MKQIKTISLLLILFGQLLNCPILTGAELFYFKDPTGALHFTNVPDDPRYQLVDRLKIEKTRKKALSSNFSDFRSYIEDAAKKYEVDPLLIRALIKVESDYDPFAVSNSGAQGLMQLMPGTSRRMDVGDPFNPEENIEGGVKYFKKLLSLFNGQLIPSIAAYHAGENRVIKNDNQIPPIEATQNYVKKVISQYNAFHGVKTESPHVYKIYRIETADGDVIYTNRPGKYEGLSKEIAYQ
ncbi:MAG: lytic transglycosylase domain-containing protein [Nitrospirae bacterium]|nr:lytic transglycosylase domain-containing protein [Nitrospirota bacterium]MBI3593783.1 lytic transglycosylase domain-containing protein [Nitrospirota bacterium]